MPCRKISSSSICAHWGPPDAEARDGVFTFPVLRAGNLLVAVQPDRGIAANRKTDYHDTGLPPCHSYVAFYVWLRHYEKIDAMIHCGTHGTLEWLPGKAVALSDDCAPEAVLGRAARHLSFHRQQSGRGGAGQTAHLRAHHRSHDAAFDACRQPRPGARNRSLV